MADITQINPDLAFELRELAAQQYLDNLERIEMIRKKIDENRQGVRPLIEIGDDLNRRKRRLDRAQAMGFENAVERVNGEADFQDVSIVHRLDQIRPTVCRIAIRTSTGATGYGTGFMISPELMITNHHVIPDRKTASSSLAQFGYEIKLNGEVDQTITFRLKPNRFFMTSTLRKIEGQRFSGLDFTIVAVEKNKPNGQSVSKFGFTPLDQNLGKILDGERCVAIQHPKGDYKKIVLKDIRMITVSDDMLIYESDTNKGSSGSPVIALGTGKVVALHHSAVPKMDSQGNWLRKDGGIWHKGDGEDAIAWAGNEGVRISRILEAVRSMPLESSMEELRSSIFNQKELEYHVNTFQTVEVPKAKHPTEAPKVENTSMKIDSNLQFELLLSEEEDLQTEWVSQASSLIPGFISTRALFPGSTDEFFRRMYYLKVQSLDNPWELAAEIEQLPYVRACTPDLPWLTDQAPDEGETDAYGVPTESTIKNVIYNDTVSEWNEDRFIRDWSRVPIISNRLKKDRSSIRNWNHEVVNWKGFGNLSNSQQKVIRNNIQKLRFVQLDTGYSSHSKVYPSYDLKEDMDFIDQDTNAQDEFAKWGFKFPAHGTRTASIAVGGDIQNDAKGVNGHRGILTDKNGKVLQKLTPYRVAQTVALIGRGRDMFEAVQYAIETQTDVMFMCLGGYPRPMFEAIARKAYESGVIWVCAAGNKVELVIAPAMYPGTIAVAAVNPEQRPWKGSSNGKMVDIAAPGEDVYVPTWDKYRNEIMTYGNGTSYATPHVAAAAMLWKAKNYDAIRTKYEEPWQVVEGFRKSLKETAGPFQFKDSGVYGAGLLNIDKLLKHPLPPVSDDEHKYRDKPLRVPKDLGIRETIHFVWNVLKRKVKRGPTESFNEDVLTDRARITLESMRRSHPGLESTFGSSDGKSDLEILKELFDQDDNS